MSCCFVCVGFVVLYLVSHFVFVVCGFFSIEIELCLCVSVFGFVC